MRRKFRLPRLPEYLATDLFLVFSLSACIAYTCSVTPHYEIGGLMIVCWLLGRASEYVHLRKRTIKKIAAVGKIIQERLSALKSSRTESEKDTVSEGPTAV